MNARHGSSFTASQWQELEHQALIFKYMISGVPIPPDLIFPIKRSLDYPLSSRLFPQQPIGWGSFQVGFCRKADPEPGRCRRTDGKKWRCSKEAYPDSKYCERHMHRGRNRSRKPVEVIASNPPTPMSSIGRTQSTTATKITSTTTTIATPYSQAETRHHNHPYYNASHYSFLHPYSSSRPPGIGFSPQNNSTHLQLLDSGSYSHADKYYRDSNGLKGGVDEIPFSEVSATVTSVPDSPFDNPRRFTPLRMSSSSLTQPQRKSYSPLQRDYTQLQLQNFIDISKHQQERQNQEQHRFILGADIKSERPLKVEREEATQQPLLHFFDEWPPKNRDYSTTKLSISIPMPSPDLPVSNSRN